MKKKRALGGQDGPRLKDKQAGDEEEEKTDQDDADKKRGLEDGSSVDVTKSTDGSAKAGRRRPWAKMSRKRVMKRGEEKRGESGDESRLNIASASPRDFPPRRSPCLPGRTDEQESAGDGHVGPRLRQRRDGEEGVLTGRLAVGGWQVGRLSKRQSGWQVGKASSQA